MMGPAARAGLLLLGGLVAAGCGYSLSGSLPPHIKTVAVPVLKNTTQQPGIEGPITNAIANALTQSGRVRVVDVGSADAVLEGEIIGYQVTNLAVDRNLAAREFSVQVTVNIRFRDLVRNELLWREDGLQEIADLRVQDTVSNTIAGEEVAVRRAAVELGRRIASLAIDLF
ncbi:MAG: penicillin-binding protein activator LpoB [Candidatus Rokubacteria bacterium]|nr:penicillin-binding protein activator LpoB [Candidatus Rokubacteria bacterium]